MNLFLTSAVVLTMPFLRSLIGLGHFRSSILHNTTTQEWRGYQRIYCTTLPWVFEPFQGLHKHSTLHSRRSRCVRPQAISRIFYPEFGTKREMTVMTYYCSGMKNKESTADMDNYHKSHLKLRSGSPMMRMSHQKPVRTEGSGQLLSK